MQGLPFLANPKEAQKVVGEWPAYRVSTTHVMTMQHRLIRDAALWGGALVLVVKGPV